MFTSFSGAGFGEMLVTPKKLSDFLAAKAIVRSFERERERDLCSRKAITGENTV